MVAALVRSFEGGHRMVRSWCVAVVLVAAAGLLAGCANTITGQARAAGSVSSLGVSGGGGSAGVQPSAVAVSGSCVPATPVSCLMPAPDGSRPYSKEFPAAGMLTSQQFVQAMYSAATDQERTYQSDRLSALGLVTIAERNWVASNTDQAQVLLLVFGSDAAAKARALGAEQGYQDQSGSESVTLSGLPSAVVAYQKPAIDSYGNVAAAVFGNFGTVELEVFFFSPAKLDQSTLTGWLSQQAALLSHLS
jgi:predicted small secreted protein